MNNLDTNRLVTLLAVITMMLIAGSFGYRLQVNTGGGGFRTKHQQELAR
jgi:hypothetical protein